MAPPPAHQRWLQVTVFGALVLLGAAWAALSSERRPPPPAIGEAAPDFLLPKAPAAPGAAPGEEVALSNFKGKVVLLNFWATWCKPCEDEMPAMQRLHQKLAPHGFVLLALSVDTGADAPAEVAAFVRRLGLTFPVLLDTKKRAARRYGSARYPESFLIGREGRLAARYIGPKEWDAPAYEARIRRLLAENPLPPPAQ